MFCTFLDCVDETFRGIPCYYIPVIDDLLNKDCAGCFVFPSLGNLRQLLVRDHNNYDGLKIQPQFLNKSLCFHPNKIEKINFTNIDSAGYFNLNAVLQSPIIGLNNLKEAKLAGCVFDHPYFNMSLSFPSLTSLDLSRNNLTLEEYGGKFLVGPTSVTYLNLAQNLIKITPQKFFRTMHALEVLDLEQNFLTEFSLNLIYLPRLRKISVNGNHISSFSRSTMEQFNEHARKTSNRVSIDLRNNPLLCTCNERDFVRWIQDAKMHNLHFDGIETVECVNGDANREEILKVDLDKMKIHCLSPSVYISVSVCAAVGLTVVIVGLGLALYRKRWWFRYKYFLITKMYKQHQQQQEAHRDYEYDAFVSCSSRDELWIIEELQPKLEDEFGLKLCLHERDFVLGGDIMEQITSSIENSRKTLLILSPNFLASTWCHWEMNLAHHHLLTTGQDVLMLAILSPMSKVAFF